MISTSQSFFDSCKEVVSTHIHLVIVFTWPSSFSGLLLANPPSFPLVSYCWVMKIYLLSWPVQWGRGVHRRQWFEIYSSMVSYQLLPVLLDEIIRESIFEVVAAGSRMIFFPDAISVDGFVCWHGYISSIESSVPNMVFLGFCFFSIVIEAQNSSTKTRSSRDSGMEWEIIWRHRL